MEPVIPGFLTFDALAYSFLITHVDSSTQQTRRILFDLGVRKDWKNLAPSNVSMVENWKAEVHISNNVSEVLTSNGVDPSSIEALIWSHAHWDHTGDPSKFPQNVDLVVGPGIKSTYSPGYPENPNAPILASDFANRKVVELTFDDATLEIGNFKAIDYFADGSLYLLSAPGHALGHLNALARTSAGAKDTFIYMAGDSFHHPSQLRPNAHLPLPTSLKSPKHSCPCDLESDPYSVLSVHPSFTPVKPFLRVSRPPTVPSSIAVDPEEADETIAKIQRFDSMSNVFVLAAHDKSVFDVIRLFPEEANDWHEQGWKEKGRWRWIRDYENAVSEAGDEKGSNVEHGRREWVD